MNFLFHPEAKDEFNEAIEYYEDCEPGLGYDFSIEVHAAIQIIINYPTAWPIIDEDVRRCLVNRFPYAIIYSIEQDGIFILAVMRMRRHPDYWRNRR
ncbi:MAG: type II toxin-antitoxin system RelE/ParE family toxin [Thermodesulfobacteriota bacterium]|nr:type II toxin-antitoxin system RelE/ParE family toxin [Thermodesulfobacteriota bacterium]